MLATWLVSAAALAVSGKDFYEDLIASTPVYEDEAVNNYIRELGEKIVAQTEMAGEKFTFTVMDSPVLNAFATRDNYVYVNRGLLNYVSNEAQLVSVMAHEVAHITRGHVDGQESKAFGTEAVAIIAAVLSGSGDVYEATRALGASVIHSHGRNNELEADQYGAIYMAKLGYDTDEMLNMLEVLKDKELLDKSRTSSGTGKPNYHGLFSTHPRNDARLRSAVSRANSKGQVLYPDGGAARYRSITDGLIWGENFLAKRQDPERYSNMDLRVRFDYPDGWQYQTRGIVVSGQPEEKNATLTMEYRSRTLERPDEYLFSTLNITGITEGRAISPANLKGYTGVIKGKNGKPDQRIAVIYYKYNAYIFRGHVDDQADFAEADKQFLDAISTFRPISRREIAGQKPKRVQYVKATSATTFEALGRELNLSSAEVEDLRLINGLYPNGEPRAGQWIKIFRQ